MGCSGAQPTKNNNEKNNKDKKDSKKKKSDNNFEVKFFSEDESSSGTFSLNDKSENNDKSSKTFTLSDKSMKNDEEKNSSEKEGENKSHKSKKSKADIRVFDYSSDESESSINYEVIDLLKRPPPKEEEPQLKPTKKESIKPKESIAKPKEPSPKKEDSPKKETPKEEPSPKKESPKKETPPKEPSPKKETPPKRKEKEKKKYKTLIQKGKRLSEPKIEEIKEESVSSEFESEKIDSPHPSIIIEANIKENIYSEYTKNRNFYDPEEKNISFKLDKDSYDKCPKNKYRKNILLHNLEITSICSLDGITKNISYATSSLDNTIKFWNSKFKLIDTISNLLVPSLYLCEFDFINILSAEGVFIKMYDIESEIYECKFIFRDHIDIIKVIYPIVTKNSMNFLSGGKDGIIRLWQRDNENPIRYYEGHNGIIIDIKTMEENKKKLMISLSENKKCIIWEMNNSNMIKEIELYFTPLNLTEMKNGFGIGGYDNKIRIYGNVEKNFELKECIITKFYGNKILFADDNNIFSLDANGNINLIDIVGKKMVIKFESNNSNFVQYIKSYDWNPDKDEYENSDHKRFGEDRTIIAINKDGYVYTYKSELFKKLKIYPKQIFRKKENMGRKDNRGKTLMKKKRISVTKPKDKRISFSYSKMTGH